MQVKRLRRIKDGLIYPFNINMAKIAGMEVVMCDENNRVIQNYGEEGEPTVRGIKYTQIDRVGADQDLAASQFLAPSGSAIPAQPPDLTDTFDGEVRYGENGTESG